MLPLEALKSMNIMVATPCYGGLVAAHYTRSIFQTTSAFQKEGVYLNLELSMGESLVTRARNRLVSKFLANPDLTHLFFIDADIGFDPNQFARELLADRQVSCGVYPLKHHIWPDKIPAGMSKAEIDARYQQYPYSGLLGITAPDEFGFAEVKEATTGFMCIKREVFERMREAYPDLWYHPDENPQASETAFFDTMIEPETGRYMSEDFAFCRRWRDIGGKVWIDCHSKLNHQGVQTWYGDLMAHRQVSLLRRVQ